MAVIAHVVLKGVNQARYDAVRAASRAACSSVMSATVESPGCERRSLLNGEQNCR